MTPRVIICIGLIVVLAASLAPAQELLSRPEILNYTAPDIKYPPPRVATYDAIDVAVLALGLALASYFALVTRSRKALLVLTVFSLAWFGFWRRGCVCPIGAIQNVTCALADPAFALPWTVVAFFVLPIAFALLFGRTFCAAVCPLGAVQELVSVRPIKVPPWLDHALGLVPFIYLGVAVLYAVTGTAFVICEYDPFVGFFRMSFSTANLFVWGACFLVVGIFVGRPYCRYVCPYGAILGLCSRVSKRHVRIPPEECIQCRLCEDVCPYGAINGPIAAQSPQQRVQGRKRLVAMLCLLPVLIGLGGGLGYGLAVPLSQLHPTVWRAEYVLLDEQSGQPKGDEGKAVAARQAEEIKHRTDAVQAFRNTGRPVEELYDEAISLRRQFARLGTWLGAWIGLVIGIKLIHLSIRRRRTEYEPDRANCVSCGRCFWYCPKEQVRLGLIDVTPAAPLGAPVDKKE